MDRDPSENAIDPEERVTPSTGDSHYGETGDARRRKAEDEGGDPQAEALPPEPQKVPLNPD